MCGVPLPWWVEEIEKDKNEKEQNGEQPDVTVPDEDEAEKC